MTSSFNATQLLLPPSLFAFLHIPPSLPSLSFPFSFCLYLTLLPASRAPPPSPLSPPLLYISPLAHSSPLDASLPPLLPLSQVSDRPISAPMIAVGVLAWQLSRWWQEPGSAWELILPLLLRPSPSHHDDRQRGRERERQRERERETDDSRHLPSIIHRPSPCLPPNNHHDSKAQSLCQLLAKDF